MKRHIESCSIEELKCLAAACYISPRTSDINIYTEIITMLEEKIDSYNFTAFLAQLKKLADIRRQCTPRKKEF